MACTALLATLPYALIDTGAAAKKRSPNQCPPAPALQLGSTNIVTGEPDAAGRLRVWAPDGGVYENIWTVECRPYDSVAIGDADGDDSTREIVGTTRSTVTEGKGKARTSWYDVHFDAYQEDVLGVWVRSEGVREDRVFWANEIAIADVDADGDNEVVMITYHWLVVYEFDGTPAFRIRSSLGTLVQNREVITRSLSVANVDEDLQLEILVSAIDRNEDNLGYVFIFQDPDLTVYDMLTIDARLGDQSLRAGDLNGDSQLELVSTGAREANGLYQPFLFVWQRVVTQQGVTWQVVEEALTLPSTEASWFHAAVGELHSESPGEEIVVALSVSVPEQIALYGLVGGTLEEVTPRLLLTDYFSLTINNVLVADSDGEGLNEIVVSGAGRTGRNSGVFYLEVLDGDLEREFRRLGGERGEREIWHAAVG